nr:uracil-DNA glycosylase [Desulfobacterales bacterium]
MAGQRLKYIQGSRDIAIIDEAIEDTKTYLRYVKGMGIFVLHLSEESIKTLESWSDKKGSGTGETLIEIRKDLGNCRRCSLHRSRKNIVFGAGNPNSRLVFVGEAPGYEEDLLGEPFVGRAGQLLTRIIRAINLSREEVYVCNVIKCRPPRNRNPEPEEIATCSPFLFRQLGAINPKVICTLGTFAAQTLLQTRAPISELRGKFFKYQGITVMPTYHPAFLLRNPEKKREVWEDMQNIRKVL